MSQYVYFPGIGGGKRLDEALNKAHEGEERTKISAAKEKDPEGTEKRKKKRSRKKERRLEEGKKGETRKNSGERRKKAGRGKEEKGKDRRKEKEHKLNLTYPPPLEIETTWSELFCPFLLK